MKNLRLIRQAKGISMQALSREIGIDWNSIQRFETGKTRMLKKHLGKIADYFNVTVEELSKDYDGKLENKKHKYLTYQDEVIEKKQQVKSRPCLNEKCPLNKDKLCINDVVLSGKAPCFGKDKVQDKDKEVKFNNTKALFLYL